MNGRILIIDDEETLCYFLKESLEEKGYRALAVHTAGDGLDQLARRAVDLVLLDLKLPDGEGLDVLQEIRRVDEDLPVIVLTGHAAVDSAVRAMKLGAYDYLEKPINLAQLSSSVAEALNSSRRQRWINGDRLAEQESVTGVVGEEEEEIVKTEAGEPAVGPGDSAELSGRLRRAEGALERAEALNAIWCDLLRCTRVYEIAEAAAEGLVRLRSVDMLAIFVGDGEEGDLVLASQRRCPPGLRDDPHLRRIPLNGVIGQAITRWEMPLPLSEAGPDPWVKAVSEELGSGVATALVPLREKACLRGVMLVVRRGRRPYVQQEMEFFGTVGESLALVMGRASDLGCLRDKMEWLSAREERQRAVLENMTVGVVVVDGQGLVWLVSPAAERLLDCDEEESLGREIEHLLGQGAAVVRDSLDHDLAYPHQETAVERDGQTVPLWMSVSPLWADGGSTNGAVVVLGDLTRVKEAEEERSRAERLAVLAGISGVVAHEIRNPLAGMAAGIQHLLTKVAEEDDKHQALQRILKEGERVNRVIEDILLITRSPHLDLEPCDLSEVVKQVASRWEDLAHRQGVRVRQYHSPGFLPVKADRDRLSQALGNLVVNGIEAMRNGGQLDITVTASPSEETGYAEVEIRDRGSGIRDGDRERIFEAFYTTKPRATGLGLTIAQRIINEHGGEIDIESEEGTGTKVIVRLPLAGRAVQ